MTSVMQTGTAPIMRHRPQGAPALPPMAPSAPYTAPPADPEPSSANSGRRRRWVMEEDEQLRKLVESQGPKRWKKIAQMLATGRTPKQCRQRWYENLHPDIVAREWTEVEDDKIVECHKEKGSAWVFMSSLLPGRTANQIKNRFHSTKRAALRRLKNGGTRGGSGPIDDDMSPLMEYCLQLARDGTLTSGGRQGSASQNSRKRKIQTLQPLPAQLPPRAPPGGAGAGAVGSSGPVGALVTDGPPDDHYSPRHQRRTSASTAPAAKRQRRSRSTEQEEADREAKAVAAASATPTLGLTVPLGLAQGEGKLRLNIPTTPMGMKMTTAPWPQLFTPAHGCTTPLHAAKSKQAWAASTSSTSQASRGPGLGMTPRGHGHGHGTGITPVNGMPFSPVQPLGLLSQSQQIMSPVQMGALSALGMLGAGTPGRGAAAAMAGTPLFMSPVGDGGYFIFTPSMTTPTTGTPNSATVPSPMAVATPLAARAKRS